MITAVFTSGFDHSDVSGLWQYDYGQKLRIQGLNLPPAVEIHFSLNKSGGDSESRVGITKDGVTDVPIPDSMLENNGSVQNYYIYAFIYITDETSGKTVKLVQLHVNSRPKPEAFDSPEEAKLFREAIAAVNDSADRAETAQRAVEEAKEQVAKDKEEVLLAKNAVKESEKNVTENKEYVRQAVDNFTSLAENAVDAVNTAGQNQVNNIEEAGRAALDNISTGVDETLTQSGKAADAKKTGERIDELKGDIARSKEAIKDLSDKKITKFYASNLGETTLNDSDNGKIADMMLYGKSEQKQYSGKNLLNPTLGTTTINGVTCTANGDGTYTLNGTASADTTFYLLPRDETRHISNGTYYITGCLGGSSKSYYIQYQGRNEGDTDNTVSSRCMDGTTLPFEITEDTKKDFIIIRVISGTSCNNIVLKPMLTTDTSATYDDYEPYVGGIPSPNPDYPQEIEAVVNPAVELAGIVRDGTDSNLLSDFQLKWLVENYDKWHDDEHIVLFSEQWNRLYVFNPNVYDGESDIFYYGYIIYSDVISVNNGRFNQHMYQITYYPYVYLYSVKEFTFKRAENRYLKSSIADSYETVGIGSKIASLPYTLNAIPVDSGGNVTIDGQQYIADYVDVENKQLVRMVGELDITNVNFSNISENKIGAYNLSITIKTDSCRYCKCTHYHTFDSHTSIKNSFSVGQDGSFIGLNNSQGFTSVSEAKAYLQNEFSKGTPVTIYYPLKEPTVTDLTDEEVQEFIELATYYPTTNVIITSDQLDGYTKFNYPLSMENGWNLIKEQLGDTRDYIYDMDLQSAEAYVNSEYAVALAELEV